MYISRLRLRNWRNFTNVDVAFGETTYLLGPNASGKSNFMDVLRFLRDITKPKGGGLQQALDSRGGLTKVRSLAARRMPQIEIEVELREDLSRLDTPPSWRYELHIKREGKGLQRPVVLKEAAWQEGVVRLQRPDESDRMDPERLTETHLEQTQANSAFREIQSFFSEVLYLHLVPQLLKYSDQLSLRHLEADPFGQGFLESISKAQERTRESRLRHIQSVLPKAVPNLKELQFIKDNITGRPHLQMRYEHWRPQAGWQREDQFSDGTLRLIAMMWTLLSSNSLILLEEPELSLHEAVVGQIPALIHQTRQYRRKSGGQVLISTHSAAMLNNQGMNGKFLILEPGKDGEATRITTSTTEDDLALRSGLSPADVLLQRTRAAVGQLNEAN